MGSRIVHRGALLPEEFALDLGPPRIVGVDRSVRRLEGGRAVVAVQLKGRPWLAVLGDMIEGVVVANRLQSPAADRVRSELWSAVGSLTAAAGVAHGRVA